MSAIPAASVNLKTMVDGTLRISFDIEPAHAKDAFNLFSSPGTQVAIAALKDGSIHTQKPGQPKKKIGPYCKLAVQWCKDEHFQIWCGVSNEESAKEYILATCECEGDSRKELDDVEKCGAIFDEFIRKLYMKQHLKENT